MGTVYNTPQRIVHIKMPFLLSRKKVATMSQKHGGATETKTIKVSDPTPALSAMSIQYDGARQPGTTYQQPLPSPSGQAQSYQQPYQKPYTSVLSAGTPAAEVPQLGLKELRGLQTVADGSFTRPNAGVERRPSAVQTKLSAKNRRPSTAATPSRPPLPHASTSQGSSYQRPYTADAHSAYKSRPSYHRKNGSASSESSYAASETSDILYNSSANGRTSSGGTSATTPGGSDRERERNLSIKPLASTARPSPPVIERIPVPSPIQEERRPVLQRPVSDASMSTAAMSERSTFSPAISQTSSMARKTSSRYTLSDFNFIRTLGTGSFGRVHLVRSCHNTRFYAIKVLNKERVVRMKQVEHTNSEREMLERVRHPFLVNLWGTFKDAKNLYMVMDFVSGGELFSLLRKSQVSNMFVSIRKTLSSLCYLQRFPDPVAKFFAAEVALALDYLHSLDIIYRDLKPENLLLAADGHVKVTDFGFAKYVPDITWTLCGTPDYLAPEVVQSKGYNKSVDWYALGVLIFEMLVRVSLHQSTCRR